ncbi:centriolar and ciliogenesis-associated protein HYSL1 isoform X1 [Pleuronectes platessa]|uniref:centriolar and ciliogenesis-associated protein HYSL1 isoform X1 n=2 Tax=Pleuronectes platessa TaxID=8262 RepID=UPI00232A3139|nr:centriolar and ciliogenesis-associated protein HYSL1 isoform X1 [Pleuronectes platessa]
MLTSSCDRILRGGFSPPPRPEAVNTMDALDFTEEEIQEQLAILGYRNIPKHRLHEFKQDLDDLIRRGEWKSLTSPKQTDATSPHSASSQPSPPPYTKEKVSQSYFQGSDEGFFLHSTKTDHESQVHNTSQIRRCEQQQGNRDSYARYSVAPKLQLHSGAPSRRQVEQHPEDLLHPSLTDSYTSPPPSQGRRLIKRKVLRKHEGQSLVCDESFFSEDSASGLEEGLAELHVSSSTQQDFETENEDVPCHSSEEDRISLSAFESYISCMTESESDFDLRPKPKSFIRPAVNQQNLKKTDPVTKYFQYKQFWEAFKVPGERDRRALRWEIRERLALEPPPTKPRRVLVPNTYTVPTEKKRAALRWEIRSDLAHGLIPHKLSHGC